MRGADWLISDLDRAHKADLVRYMSQARQWGVVVPLNLRNNDQRREAIRHARVSAAVRGMAGQEDAGEKRYRSPPAKPKYISAREVNEWLATI